MAQYRLGTLYEHGQGVAIDPDKAAQWYELSAAQGNRKAMHNLAFFMRPGRTWQMPRAGLLKLPLWVCRIPSSTWQFCMKRGDGVPQSLVDAFKWYSIAAAAGDLESSARVAACNPS